MNHDIHPGVLAYIRLDAYSPKSILKGMSKKFGRILSALSDPTRLRCVLLLLIRGELCVCEITQVLRVSQPNVSRHLIFLKKVGLLSSKRCAQWVYYKMNPNLEPWILEMIKIISLNTRNIKPYQRDLERAEIAADQATQIERCGG